MWGSSADGADDELMAAAKETTGERVVANDGDYHDASHFSECRKNF